MNFPEVIEYAIKETIRTYAGDCIPVRWLRSAQQQGDAVNADGRQYFPQLLITSSSKFRESEGCTWAVSFEVACITWHEDDPGASQRAAMFEDVERIMDALVEADADNEIRRYFIGKVLEHRPTFALGGMTPIETTPELENGAQIFSYRGTFHFSL